MSIVVNEDEKLEFILTQYGLNRIAEALQSETVRLNISKIKVGDANGEYYEPTDTATDLVHQISGGTFYITDKDLLEDGYTVSFRAIIPENFSNCEIREVGLYETVEGEDHLFAISTQQPLLKPSTEIGYLISVDYYAFLKSKNLADAYEQIILDPDNQLVTQDKLDALMSTILFTEANLMEQVNSNTRVIGLNRNQQLYDLISEEQKSFGYVTAYNNCATLLDYIDQDNLFAYWIFDYPRRVSASASIIDIGPANRNLSTNVQINQYARSYEGFASYLDFSSPNYYYLSQGAQELSYYGKDFTVFPKVDSMVQIDKDGIATNFTADNYITTSALDTSRNFQIVTLFKEGSVNGEETNTSPIVGDADGNIEILARENNVLGVNVKLSDGSIKQLPVTEDVKVNDNTWRYVRLTKDGTSISMDISLDASSWTNLVNEDDVDIYASSSTFYLGRNAAGTAGFLGTLDLKDFTLSVDGIQIASGGRYETVNELIFLNSSRTEDTPFTVAFTVEPIDATLQVKRTLLARSNYSSDSHYFEINETAGNEVEVILFADASNYITFTSTQKDAIAKAHSLIVSYEATKKVVRVFVNGKEVSVEKEVTGTYDHMNDSPSELYAFSCNANRVKYADSNTAPTKLLNADGTPSTDSSWSIQGTNVVYVNNTASYSEDYNKSTSGLYAWASGDNKVYTKSTEITESTVLYNADYTLYSSATYPKFEIIQSGEGGAYIIAYNDGQTSVGATREEASDISAATLYAFVYTGALQTIWANSSTTPSSLYYYNGDTYDGEDWTIVDNEVYWEDIKASYSYQYNRSVAAVPVTSYVVDKDGKIANLINSKVASAIVVKELLSDDEIRALSLLLEATRGENPCIYIS